MSDAFRCVAKKGIVVDGKVAHCGDEIDLTFDQAISHISNGNLELAARQNQPPLQFVKYATGLLKGDLAFEKIGPECKTIENIARVAEQLIQDGRRVHTVQGREIKWGFQSFERDLRLAVCDQLRYDETIFFQINRPYQAAYDEASLVRSNKAISDSEAEARGLVFVRDNWQATGDRRDRYEYVQVGSDWYAYRRALNELSERSSDFVQNCLKEGRVLLFDIVDDGGGLISPHRWQRTPFSQIEYQNLHYVFSRDLPPQWFNEGKGPRGREVRQQEKHARAWLEKEYAALQKAGERMIYAEFEVVAQREFGLSGNAVRRVWKTAEIPAWKKGGRPKARSK